MLRPALKKPPRPASNMDVHWPAPTGGLNLLQPATAMKETDCLLLYNLLGAEQGLRARLGYREWCTGLTGTDANEVRGILPFTASQPTNGKLFATTEDAIWDVTTSTASPSQSQAFNNKTARSGRGIPCVTTTAAGHFLLYADEENGYYYYSEATGAWVQPTYGTSAGQVGGVDPANIAFVMVWKNRVWFVERDCARGWYLPTYAITGVATAFNFGTKFRAGGFLVGLYSWTIDGGAGLDDSLVAISSGGDVSIYQGTDPDTAGFFGLQGVWFVGAVPAGRHIATNFGGDLLILSSLGVLPASRLVAGANSFDPSIYLTKAITPLISSVMATARNFWGWSLRMHPRDNCLMITIPTPAPDSNGKLQPTTQLAYCFATQSWSIFGPIDSTATAGTRGLPILSAETYDGNLYFGTVDGRVCMVDEYVDAVLLTQGAAAVQDVQWSFLTGFNNLGTGKQKQVQMIRPVFLSGTDSPAYSFNARYNLDQSELAAVTSPAGGSQAWDTAVWDTALWGADQKGVMSILGATGMGPHVAIAGRGTARSKTILAGLDIVFTVGGFL